MTTISMRARVLFIPLGLALSTFPMKARAWPLITPDGLSAENVELPTGSHRVTLSIADTSGKTASRTFRFSVVQ